MFNQIQFFSEIDVSESNLIWESSADWEDRLGICRSLVGPFPEEIDFVDGPFPDLNSEFRPITAVIENDPRIRKLRFPSEQSDLYCLEIRGLTALEELIVECESSSELEGALQWIRLENNPLLKFIKIRGGVRSLEIMGCPSLVDLDVSECVNLDRLVISKPNSELNLNIEGCIKLRDIPGLDAGYSRREDLLKKIESNQIVSRRDGTIYDCMTFTDIDIVSDLINEGVKAMSRRRVLSPDIGDSILGAFYLAAYDSNFKPYPYRILEPLEPVYTGGTGETYSYVFVERDVSSEDFSFQDEEGAGNSTPEDCLEYMLHWARMGLMHVPGIRESSDEQLLAILKDVVAKTPVNAMPDFSFEVSSLIDQDSAQTLKNLISEVGAAHEVERSRAYIYIHPNSGIPENEGELARGAALCVETKVALHQLTALRDWFKSNPA
jgi:hypothetical protein